MERRSTGRYIATIWATASLALAVLWPYWDRLLGLAPACGLKSLTGYPCLTCGSTRAIRALLGGDLGAACTVNPLTTLGVGILFLGGLASGLWLLGVRPDLKLRGRNLRWALAGALVLLAANWVYLLISNPR